MVSSKLDDGPPVADGPDPRGGSIHPDFTAVPGGVIRFDADGRIVDGNARAARLLQLSREEMFERTSADLARLAVHENGTVCTLSDFPPQVCTRTGEPEEATLGLRLGDRSLTWIVMGAAPIEDDGGVIATMVDVTALKRADAALRLSEQRFRSMFERHEAVMMLIDFVTGAIVDANGAAERFYGWPRERLRTMLITDINQLPMAEIKSNMARAARESSGSFVFPHRLASGELRQVEVNSSPIEYEEKRLLFSIVHDVTYRERLEDELRQSQKHEAIGQLSGGVAHAFYNTLTVMNGCVEQLLEDASSDHPWRETLDEVFESGIRAADLTRQLLAFSRKELIQPEVFDLNELVSNFEATLLRLIGEHIEVEVDLDDVACAIKADRRSIEQVLMNLAVNARDAMRRGGRLTITTALEAGYEWSSTFVGPRVVLTVRDNGHGMDEETRSRAFEPFFTTKSHGEATGLGLATVYGIVRQAAGAVELKSDLGVGTTVTLSFRVASDPVTVRTAEGPLHPVLGGTETILLVEDESGVRSLAVRSLERRGYRVLAASRGDEAVEIAKRHNGPIHLLVTDVVMPGMSGPELAKQVRSIRSDIRAFYISGYAENQVDESDLRLQLLPKPFTPSSLIQMVRQVLGKSD